MSEIGSFPAHRLTALKPKAKNTEGIGGRLKAARSNLRLKQEAVAAHLGVGTRTYVEREAGRRAMSVGEIEAMGALGVNIHWLVTGKGDMMSSHVGSTATGFAESPSADASDWPLADRPSPPMRARMTVEEIGGILRATQAGIDEAVRLGGWQPPRVTQEAIIALLFPFALRGLFPSEGDLVEFLARLRHDLEKSR